MAVMPESVDKKRLQYIDAARAVGISMIVLSHIFGYMGLGSNAIWRWMNLFMVGLFFLLSGYLAAMQASKPKQSYPIYVLKKFKSLLVPFIYYSVIALAIKLVVAHFIGVPLSEQINPAVYEFFTLLGTGALWFLPAFFFADIVFYWVMRLNVVGKLIILVISWCAATFAIMILPYCPLFYVVMRGLTGLGFMVIGYEWMPLIEKKFSGWQIVILIAVSGVITLIMPQFLVMDFRSLVFEGNPIWMYLSTTAASICLIQGFRLIESKVSLKPLAKIGRNALTIMCTHNEWYLVIIVCTGLNGLMGPCTTIGGKYYLVCAMALVLILLLEHGICDGISLIKKLGHKE